MLKDALFVGLVIVVVFVVLSIIGAALPADPPRPWQGAPSPFGAQDQLGL